jgi:hypothetical protein
MVTVVPATVQMGVVSEAKLTVRPEVADALTVTGRVPSGSFDSALNVIVWLNSVADVIWKLWMTGVAAA